MSVLIKGMEMPKGCLLCRFFDPIHEVCLGMERAEKTILSDKYKHPACPLVEVPGGRVFGIRDGILYEANVKIPDNWGKTVKIPPIKLESEE